MEGEGRRLTAEREKQRGRNMERRGKKREREIKKVRQGGMDVSSKPIILQRS